MHVAVALIYSGHVIPKEVGQKLIIDMKRKITFVDWCPTGFKCGINHNSPVYIPGGDIANSVRCVGMLHNTTAI